MVCTLYLIVKLKDEVPYSKNIGGGKLGEFGESSAICQTKTIQISSNLLADLFSYKFFAKLLIYPLLPNVIPAKLSCYIVHK